LVIERSDRVLLKRPEASTLSKTDCNMSQLQHHLEQIIALTLIAFAVGMWFGEAPRDVTYGK